MTDNGLAALAAAMHKRLAIHGRYTPKCICNFDAAAILGERGVFLPDGLGRESCDPPCGDCCREHPHWSHVHSDQFGARPPTVRETLERLGLPQTTGRIPPEIVHPAPFADDNPALVEAIRQIALLNAEIATLRAALERVEDICKPLSIGMNGPRWMQNPLVGGGSKEMIWRICDAALAAAKETP